MCVRISCKVETGQYIRFRKECETREPYSLLVVDDQWQVLEEHRERLLLGPKGLAGAIDAVRSAALAPGGKFKITSPKALLTMAANFTNLPGCGELVVGDFPHTSASGTRGWSGKVGANPREEWLAAVDKADETERNDVYAFEDVTDGLIKKIGIPEHRIGFFTIHTDPSTCMKYHSIYAIDKEDVGAPDGFRYLSEWWAQAIGHVDYTYFNNNTVSEVKESRHDGPPLGPHKPSILSQFLDPTGGMFKPFGLFLDELQKRNKANGVWAFIRRQLLNQRVSLVEKQFAYLCGKAFLKSGQASGSSGSLYDDVWVGAFLAVFMGLVDLNSAIWEIVGVQELPRRSTDECTWNGLIKCESLQLFVNNFHGVIKELSVTECIEGREECRLEKHKIEMICQAEEVSVGLCFSKILGDEWGKGTGRLGTLFRGTADAFGVI